MHDLGHVLTPQYGISIEAPTTHFVILAQAPLFRGAGPSAVWPQFLAIASDGAILFDISTAGFPRIIDTMA
jgi:ABC-2 type transport system permease protein